MTERKLPESLPMCSVHPVCDFRSGCDAYDASTVATNPTPFTLLNLIPKWAVPNIYCRIRMSEFYFGGHGNMLQIRYLLWFA